jgi:hypothetical protein
MVSYSGPFTVMEEVFRRHYTGRSVDLGAGLDAVQKAELSVTVGNQSQNFPVIQM